MVGTSNWTPPDWWRVDPILSPITRANVAAAAAAAAVAANTTTNDNNNISTINTNNNNFTTTSNVSNIFINDIDDER
ncbi:hypothetical protein PV325_010583 [Microctonus aethiopoides]|nr:hypothetical protein PV325_010583 [Microctonus aethiopoides]